MSQETLVVIDNCKKAFGTLAVLDEIELEDLPSVLDFGKVVANYMKMLEKDVK